MIHSRHTLASCEMCGEMVICADCGNKCCNGGSGRTALNKPCDCDEAYAHQSAFCNDPDSVRFAKDLR